MKLEKKEEENKKLKKKIEEMSSEFSTMLKETLDKMEQRIDMAQWDSNDNQVIMSKIDEMQAGKI